MFRADESRGYEGGWRDDKKHGAGVEYEADGSVSRGRVGGGGSRGLMGTSTSIARGAR